MRRPILATATALLLGCSPTLDEPGPDVPAPRSEQAARPSTTAQTMDQLFDPMASLLAAATEPGALDVLDRRAEIDAMLGRAVGAGEAVRVHAAERDPGFAHLAGGLLQSLEAARTAVAEQRSRAARFHTLQAAAICAECHSRLPGDVGGEFGMRLFSRVDPQHLSPAELALLQRATRQGDAAIATLAEGMRAEGLSAGERVSLGRAWLREVLHVRGSLEQARAGLEGWQAAPAEAWRAELKRTAATPMSLEGARALVQRAEEVGGDAAAVPALLARHHLDALIADGGGAEAWLLLGRAHQIAPGPWPGRAAFAYATAIRQAPGSELAQQAFEAYRLQLSLDWGGSGGFPLPAELAAERDELRALSELRSNP